MLAGFDPARAREIFRTWELVDLLDAYRLRVTDRALEQYRFDYMTWLVRWSGQAKPPNEKKPPELPAVLKDPRRKEFHFGDP